MPKIEIYTSPYCGYCSRAKSLLNKKGVGFEEIDVTQSEGKQAEMKSYREVCLFGPDPEGLLTFWSYTSDGKKSSGRLAEAEDGPPNSVCFEAQMDAGLARQIFWSDGGDGMNWVVEARTKKGWSRLAEHHYRPA